MIPSPMSLTTAIKILTEEAYSFEHAVEGEKSDREDYVSDLFRPGNSQEWYTAMIVVANAASQQLKGEIKHEQGIRKAG